MAKSFTEQDLRQALERVWADTRIQPEEIYGSVEFVMQMNEIEKWNTTLFTPKGLLILFPSLNHG